MQGILWTWLSGVALSLLVIYSGRTLISSPLAEQDDIFILAAYSVALKQWQPLKDATNPFDRGSNVAALLVKDSLIEAYGVSRTAEKKSLLYHAEMDSIFEYLAQQKQKAPYMVDLKDVTVYTTLEPCMMCFGTILSLHAQRVIYSQSYAEGMYTVFYQQNPKLPGSDRLQKASHIIGDELQRAYQAAAAAVPMPYGKWLGTPEAKHFYEKAYCEFNAYHVTHEQNKKVWQNAWDFLQTIPGQMDVQCH